jgi:glycosyltransferase involved in cell wall biosynthesis
MVSFAIVVPCYKQEKYVEQCITSLLECNPPPDEIIASDNYCPNNSWKILQQFDDRIRLVRPQGHLEATKHFNFLMKSSTSQFTGVVCADDFVKPNYIAVLRGLAEKNKTAVAVRAGWHNIDDSSRIMSTRRLYSLIFSQLRKYPESFVESCSGSKNPLISWAVNTKAFERVGFFDEDIDICDWSAFLALSRIGDFATACEAIAFYRSNYRPDLEEKRATKQAKDAILIGERYVLPALVGLAPRNRARAACGYLKKLTSIYQRYVNLETKSGRSPSPDMQSQISSLIDQLSQE